MSRKKTKILSKPSKAYLVSFGDTMTALLAFFIVLNSLAQDQTGAKMHRGTGSFVNAIKSIGVPGSFSGDRSGNLMAKTAPSPIYAVPNNADNPGNRKGEGPDEEINSQRIINRETDNFHRFLNEVKRQYSVETHSSTQSQFVLDTWEPLGDVGEELLGPKSLQVASDAISQIGNPGMDIELVIWANMPSAKALQRAVEKAARAEEQIDRLFRLTETQRKRIRFSAKPWLFVDAKRPIASFIISKMSKPGG